MKLEPKVVTTPKIIIGQFGCFVQNYQGTGTGLANGFMKIGKVDAIITCRRTEYVTRGKHRIQYLEGQHILAIQLLFPTFAKGNNAGLSVAVGIIKDIFKSQQVGGCIVEIPKGVGNQIGVVTHCIGNQTDISLWCSTYVWTAISTSGCCSCCMGAVKLLKPVSRIRLAQEGTGGGIFAAYIHAVLVVALPAIIQLIPE